MEASQPTPKMAEDPNTASRVKFTPSKLGLMAFLKNKDKKHNK